MRQRTLQRLFQASFVYGMSLFAMRTLAFVLLPLYTRFLAPADYGLISLAETSAAVVGTLSGLGLDNAMRRLYFEYVKDRSALSCYISTVVLSALVITALLIGIVLLVGPRVLASVAPHFPVPFYPYMALAIGSAGIFPLLSYRLALYQTEGRPWPYALLSLFWYLLTSLSAVTLVVILHRGAVGMLVGKFLAYAVASLLGLSLLRKWLSGGWQWRYLAESLHLGLPLVLFQMGLIGLEIGDRFILQHYRSITEVGLYSLAYTSGMVMWLASYALWQAWTPIFYDLARDNIDGGQMLGKISSGLVVLLTCMGLLGMAAAEDVTALVFDPRYYPAGRIIPIIIAAYVAHGVFFLLQIPALQAKKTRFLSAVTSGALAINILLNLWIVPTSGMYGAAYATLAAFGIEVLIMYPYSQHVFPLRLNRDYFMWAAISLLSVLAVTQLPMDHSVRRCTLLVAVAAAATVLWRLGNNDLAQAVKMIVARRGDKAQ